MASTGDFVIYDELQSNIRWISVVVSLSSPVDALTKAEVSQHGRQLQVVDWYKRLRVHQEEQPYRQVVSSS